jgi:D-glycero-alpha-D-manno-heptose 1-phosphate guanylyltransferase
MNREVIILAGGLGTRLKSVVADMPKPMAPVGNKPFLHYLFQYLQNFSVSKVILSVGYKSEAIESYFGNSFLGIPITYSVENEPLGTGGAIRKALDYAESSSVFILNGDTFFDVDLAAMEKQHHSSKYDLTIATKEMENFDRYGTVITNDKRVVQFAEKQHTKKGFINGGIYLMESAPFSKKEWPLKFSFENDYLLAQVHEGKFASFVSDKYFIDIGIPEDYERANVEFPQRFTI